MLTSKILIRCSAHTTFTVYNRKGPTVLSCTSYIYSEQAHQIPMVPTVSCRQVSNKPLSDGAHLVETDLMGQKDGCLTLVPKSVKS